LIVYRYCAIDFRLQTTVVVKKRLYYQGLIGEKVSGFSGKGERIFQIGIILNKGE